MLQIERRYSINVESGKMKTLIVYATRYGATALTSQEIAKILREENFEVKVVDAKKEKSKIFQNSSLLSLAAALRWVNGPVRVMIF